MYSDWASLNGSLIGNNDSKNRCTLHRFPVDIARNVAVSIVKHLTAEANTRSIDKEFLTSEKDILWCLEALCYCLSLPLADHDAVRDCVNVYCEWLSGFDPSSSVKIPPVVSQDVNFYSERFTKHLCDLFVLRKREGPDAENKQAVLCHRVLRSIQHIAQLPDGIHSETWNWLLLFLLEVNDVLFDSSGESIDNRDQLKDRVLGALIEVWLSACLKYFPSPPFWKTFREMSISWRYHAVVIEHWNAVTLLLTNRVLQILYGTLPLQPEISNGNLWNLILKLDSECAVQVWYRMLHLIGTPVDLCYPVGQSQHLRPFDAVRSSKLTRTRLCPSVNFYTTMKGVASLVDTFLNAKNIDSSTDIGYYKPACNSLLHLLGEWLFEIVYVGFRVMKNKCLHGPACDSCIKESIRLQTAPHNFPFDVTEEGSTLFRKFILGFSEAIGALCRIFCSRKVKEEILPLYVSRFYIVVHHSMDVNEAGKYDDLMASILVNSTDLLQLDLDGIAVLMMRIIRVLEFILPEKHLKLKTLHYSDIKVRQSAVMLLLTVLPYPLHFYALPVKEYGEPKAAINFGQLKLRLLSVLLNALEVEWDCYNLQILLGGFLTFIQDTSLFKYEETDTDHVRTLLFRGITMVCDHLTSLWGADSNLSLAALELLSSATKAGLQNSDITDSKQILKWLCDYIVRQCWKPPQAHSKDLHSSIVAAFQCVANWVLENHRFLHDDECLCILLEVIEVGISGTKFLKSSSKSCLKDEKDLKPSSLRVRDASEALLLLILEQIDCSLLASSDILSYNVTEQLCCRKYSLPPTQMLVPNYQNDATKYHYAFVSNNILSISKGPVFPSAASEPVVSLVTRNVCGTYLWLFQLKYFPRHKSASKQRPTFVSGRTVSMLEESNVPITDHKFFPDTVDKIQSLNIDKLMPSLESLAEGDSLGYSIEDVHKMEQCVSKFPLPFKECTTALASSAINPGRMFLSHFGMISGSNREQDFSHFSLLPLDPDNKKGFNCDLLDLDCMASVVPNVCYVFYVKSEQRSVNDILHNVTNGNLQPQFLETLHSQGWPIETCKCGDRINLTNSTQIQNENACKKKKILSSCSYSVSGTFYWTDALSRIIYIVPTTRDVLGSVTEGTCPENIQEISGACSITDHAKANLFHLPKELSNLIPVMLIWLENYEDMGSVPVNDMLNVIAPSSTERQSHCIIFLHPLQNGLIRIRVQGHTARASLSASLLNGTVVSRRVIGLLIRQTITNLNTRRISDSYPAVQFHRKLKIQEIANTYIHRPRYPDASEELLFR